MTTYNQKGRTGQQQAIGEHLLLDKKLAYQLNGRLPANVEIDDLIQAGSIGLLDAMSRYEVMESAQFETYAVQRVRGAMLDELRSNDWLSRGVRKNMRNIEQAISTLQQQLSRPPKESEIASHLAISLEAYQQLLGESAGHQLIYFEDFHQDSDGINDHFLDRFCTQDSSDTLSILVDQGFRGAVIDAINALPERDKLMMGLYYEQELNLKEIGAVLGVTESRVSQLHSQAIARIRAILKGKKWTGVA